MRLMVLPALASVLSMAVTLLMPATAFAQDESITLSPTQGPVNTRVIVHGTGWQEHFSHGLDVPIQIEHEQVADAHPDSHGEFTVAVIIPGTAPSGPVTISAIIGNGGSADATFSVTPPSATQPEATSGQTGTLRPSGATHTVVPGDTLWDIARKNLGNGLLWKGIYNLNRTGVERDARNHGHASSGLGHLIFPRLHLRLPQLPTPATRTQPIPACTHGTLLIGVRGTFEEYATHVGLGEVVSSLAGRLRQRDPNPVTTYGVPYPAGVIPTYDASLAEGVALTVAALNAHAHCEDEKILIAGYSQGAEVVRIALSSVSPDVRSKVSGVALFGDPTALGGPSADSLGIPAQSYCANQDPVCTTGSRDRALECVTFQPGCPHFGYVPTYTERAAEFLNGLRRR